MTARLLDGAALAAVLRRETAGEVTTLTARHGRPPGLAVILAGADAASKVYVRNKARACAEAGLASQVLLEPEAVSTSHMVGKVRELNADPSVDGILVQLPLPEGVDSSLVLHAVDPDKDVDGFHPLNAGALAQGTPRLVPCTPAGIMELLRRENIEVCGARAVVLGRSVIVGRPMALLLINGSATVTVTHSRTRDLAAICRQADILVAAIGRPGFVTEAMVRPGATVIDVGINRVTDPAAATELLAGDSRRLARFKETGATLVGDVHPARVGPVAGALTPVPGGVGPLTVAMLLKNTVKAYRRRLQPAAPGE